MSRTFEIACHDCKTTLWIGQAPLGVGTVGAYIYTSDADLTRLQDFLFGHMHHRLEFGDSQVIDAADINCEYRSIYPDG